MTRRDVSGLLSALLAALLGTLIFTWIGFPSAPLTGSAAAVTVAGLLGAPIYMPVWFRTVAFVLIGINIGSGVTREMMQAAVAWPLTIALLSMSLFVSLQISSRGLKRWMGFDGRDSLLAAMPGHLSFVLALSIEQDGQTARIAIVQSIRVLFLTLCVPVLVAAAFGATGMQVLPKQPLVLWQFACLVGVTFVVGALLNRFHVPAGYLLAGMACSALGHVLAITPGRPPDGATFVAFLVMGVLIGSRFAGQRFGAVTADLLAGLWVTGVNVGVALLAVGLGLLITGASPALLIVAFAPGGVEAMAAIAVSLGLDPAFVAAHHVMRLVILMVFMSAMMGRRKPG